MKQPFTTSQNPLTIGKGKLFCNDKTNASEFFDGEIESINFYSKFKEVGSYRLEKGKVVNGKLPNLLTGKYDVTLHGSFEVKKWATQDTTKLNDPNIYFEESLQDLKAFGNNVSFLFTRNGSLYERIINTKTGQIVKDFLISSYARAGKLQYFHDGSSIVSWQNTATNNNIMFKLFTASGDFVKEGIINSKIISKPVTFDMTSDYSRKLTAFAFDTRNPETLEKNHSSIFVDTFDANFNPIGKELEFKNNKDRYFAPTLGFTFNYTQNKPYLTSYAVTDTNTGNYASLVAFSIDVNESKIIGYGGGIGSNSLLSAKVVTASQSIDKLDDCLYFFWGADSVFFNRHGCNGDNNPKKLFYGDYTRSKEINVGKNEASTRNEVIVSNIDNRDKNKVKYVKMSDGIFSEITGIHDYVLLTKPDLLQDGTIVTAEQQGDIIYTNKYSNGAWEIIDVLKVDSLKVKPAQVTSYPYQIAVIQSGNQTSFNLYYGEPSSTATISIALTADSKPILTQNVTLDIKGKASIPLPNGVSNGDYFVWVTAANSNVRGNIEKFTVTAPVSTGQGDKIKPVIKPPSPTPILVNNSASDFGSPEIFETCYLTTFDDVREAVKNKKTIPSGQHHFAYHGLLEGRGKNTTFLRCVDAMKNGFSEKEYLSLYPDVKMAVKNGSLYSGLKHYILDGFSENKFKNYSEAIKDRDSIPLIAGNNNSYVEKNKIDRFYLPVLKGHTYNVIISPKDGYSIDNIDLRVLYPNSNNIINYKSSSSYNLYSSKLGKYRVLNYESIIDGKLYFYISSSDKNYYSINISDITVLPEIEEVEDYEELINEPIPILFGVRSPLDYIFDLNNPVFQGAVSALPNPFDVIDAVKIYMNPKATPSEVALANVNVWANVPVLGAVGKGAKLFKVVEKIEDASKGIIKVTVKKISVKATTYLTGKYYGKFLGNLAISSKQIQSKFKHATDFGISGNYNLTNANYFEQSIRNFVSNDNVILPNSIYRKLEVISIYNEGRSLVVILDRSGNFISAWKLSLKQLENLKTFGILGGG